MITTQRNLRRDQARGKFRCESNRGVKERRLQEEGQGRRELSFRFTLSAFPEFWISLLSGAFHSTSPRANFLGKNSP